MKTTNRSPRLLVPLAALALLTYASEFFSW